MGSKGDWCAGQGAEKSQPTAGAATLSTAVKEVKGYMQLHRPRLD
jgi:hypothetical protein